MKPYIIQSISGLHRLLELGKPEHPLISVIDFAQIKCFSEDQLKAQVHDWGRIRWHV
jgi:AraC family transcriptional activator of pobA